MVGACLRGECHYAVGNLAAEGKIAVVKRVLTRFGLSPDRLAFRMMSSAQGARFVEYATAFQDEIRALGPLGESEGVNGAELDIRLRAARNALEDKKLRWVEGKWVEFQEDGNLYGEVFTLHELKRMYGEIVLDECAIQEIRIRLLGRALSATEVAREIRAPAYRALRHLADMRRLGLVTMNVGADGVPLWTSAEGDAAGAVVTRAPVRHVSVDVGDREAP
jgi:hypothetical protein